ATNIQDAVDAAIVPGAQVVVTNGTYPPIHASGALSVQSVNGAQFTMIDGGHSNWCATLGNSVTLSGFTLSNGGYSYYYGGVSGGTLNNCILSGNSGFQGGGAYYSTLNNCILSSNVAHRAGAAYYCTLNNCSLIGNSAAGDYGEGQGGGAYYS